MQYIYILNKDHEAFLWNAILIVILFLEQLMFFYALISSIKENMCVF